MSNLVDIKVPAYSGNYTVGRSGRKIEMIAIHHMAGVLSTEQCGNIFAKVGRQASAHYGIGNDGRVGLYVDEENTAWCNGNWDSNCKSVTIETSNSKVGGNWEVSDEALNSLIKLVADIAKRNNLGTLVKGKNVVWHRMYVATTCPGEYLLSKMDYIVEEANKINAEHQPTKSIIELANEVIEGKWGNGRDRKEALEKAGYDYCKVQDKVNEIFGGNVQFRKSNEEICREVWQGKWGNGQDRMNRLKNAGYDPDEIQKMVNRGVGK